MSVVVVNGQIVGDPTVYQSWDASLSQNFGAASQDNRGCEPGWATIYVQDSVTGGTVKVCRRLDQSVLGSQASQTIAEESAPGWYDQSLINVAAAAEQVVAGAGGVIAAVTPAIGTTALLVGALALLLFAWKR